MHNEFKIIVLIYVNNQTILITSATGSFGKKYFRIK